LSKLNDYHAQYGHFTFEKWETSNVVLEGITHETQATLEFMCYGGMCYLNVNDMWYFFESLAWYQEQRERARDSFHHYSS